MKRILALISFILVFVLFGCNVQKSENEQTYVLDADGLENLVIFHDKGTVDITGIEGTDEITVHAKFVAESEDEVLAQQFLEENMEATLTKEGSVGQLMTFINNNGNKEQGHLDLKIEMPNHLMLDYRQNEGPLTLRNMNADLKLNHGIKSMLLEDIVGDVTIVDGSGGLIMNNVVGDITINKNSGKTELSETEGEMTVIAGSSDIEINEKIGNITLRSGSGNILIDDVNGDVTVLANRKGELNITNVAGNVTEPEPIVQ